MNSLTSLKLRNAWIPPEVAQAPIVTRYFEARRTSRILSLSCGVVIDPSTNDISYGPCTIALEASGKFAISTSPATARISSSQSRNVNWQPSQEANFHTAIFGLRWFAIDYISLITRKSFTRVY